MSDLRKNTEFFNGFEKGQTMTRQAKMPYQMSIEEKAGTSRPHGFHLGTIESVARSIVAREYFDHIRTDRPIVTVALKDSAGKIIDVFDGEWSSQRVF